MSQGEIDMTVRIEDLKVGMKVKLVDKEPNYHVTGGFTSTMRKFLGGVYIYLN